MVEWGNEKVLKNGVTQIRWNSRFSVFNPTKCSQAGCATGGLIHIQKCVKVCFCFFVFLLLSTFYQWVLCSSDEKCFKSSICHVLRAPPPPPIISVYIGSISQCARWRESETDVSPDSGCVCLLGCVRVSVSVCTGLRV